MPAVSLKNRNARLKLISGFIYIKIPIVAELILLSAYKLRKSGNTVNTTAMIKILK